MSPPQNKQVQVCVSSDTIKHHWDSFAKYTEMEKQINVMLMVHEIHNLRGWCKTMLVM